MGWAYPREGKTFRPDAGSTSQDLFRKEIRFPTGNGPLDGVIRSGMLELKTAERLKTLKTRLCLNYNPNVEQRKKPQTKFSQK